MTIDELRQYKKLQKEITKTENQIDRLQNKEIPVVSGKVKSSMKVFPYTEYRTSVLMEEPIEASRRDSLISIYRRRKDRAQRLLQSIEEFIDGIEDSETRLIFTYAFVDGMEQKDIAEEIGLERSSISKKINTYLKLSHNSHKNML